MVRLARFSPDAFVDAAIALVAEGGPSAASMAAIARKVGAPTGSIYHRFESRSAVLATAWAAAHASFAARVVPRLRAGDGLDAALAIAAWARADAVRARFLLLNETETLLDGTPPAVLRRELRLQEEALDAAFETYLSLQSTADRRAEAAARAKFLIFDGPIALLRPHLLAGAAIPSFIDRMIAELHGAMSVSETPGKRHTAHVA